MSLGDAGGVGVVGELELREWSLRAGVRGSTHRSVAENGFERVDVDDRVDADEEDCFITGG